jgi:uncharacterized protein
MAILKARERVPAKPRLALVDCDVHQQLRSFADLHPYLSRYWVSYLEESGFSSLPNAPYPKGANRGERVDARPAGGGPAGSDPELMRRQLLEEYAVEVAILTGSFYNVAFLPNPDLATVLARA